ncbi:MAG TPA: dihydroxyacetone kinase subunit DhaK [Methylophilaceae bacterium]|nr:dihydroxyacetone kinase subunit DhaK [Methylophilaceae bacterium]
MKKFINAIDDVLAESLTGFGTAHADLVKVHLDPNYVVRAKKAQNKVALISGGGSGHEPLHTGYIGYGMLDAACPGHVFTSPSPDQMLAAAEEAHADRGVLFIVKNYAGDVMNFEMAAEMLPFENATVLTSDDVAVENSTYTTGRRGVAGTVIVEKVVGSLAETGADLAACKALGEKVNKRTGSMGVALTSCTVPAAGRPTFDISDNELEMGVGIHGEPGRRREAMRSADAIVTDVVNAILEDLKPNRDAEALLMINGFAATPLMELYLLYNSAARLLKERGVNVTRSLVGNYTTALDMAGASVTVCLLDDEITSHWDSPVHTPALRWGR